MLLSSLFVEDTGVGRQALRSKDQQIHYASVQKHQSLPMCKTAVFVPSFAYINDDTMRPSSILNLYTYIQYIISRWYEDRSTVLASGCLMPKNLKLKIHESTTLRRILSKADHASMNLNLAIGPFFYPVHVWKLWGNRQHFQKTSKLGRDC